MNCYLSFRIFEQDALFFYYGQETLCVGSAKYSNLDIKQPQSSNGDKASRGST